MAEIDGRWSPVGVISTGLGCAEPNRPGLSTLIPLYADWIMENSDGDVYVPRFHVEKYGPHQFLHPNLRRRVEGDVTTSVSRKGAGSLSRFS